LELTIEDAALLLIASENFQIKLKRYRSGGHEINLSRGQYRIYRSMFPLLKAEWKWGFQYFRIDFETFAHIWGENLTVFFFKKITFTLSVSNEKLSRKKGRNSSIH